MLNAFWLIPLLPLLGFLINGLGLKWMPRKLAGYLACTVVGAAFVVAAGAFLGLKSLPVDERTVVKVLFPWISAGSFHVNVAFQWDQLSAVMALVVTGVGFLIHVYSLGYMAHDPGYKRYFTYLNLFTFAMLTLVLADNFLLLFVGWEGVGLCSYLLIGFWYTKDSAADAGKKAFIVNRIGDFGVLIAMFLVFWNLGSLTFSEVFQRAPEVLVAGTALPTAIALLFFLGATGKSAQIPLYVWLPDAMEGPTPVSALIHAATMVTAGVYLFVRASGMFELAPAALGVVAVIGALTAIFAASIGLVQTDIKRVLAYSTVSQLGYMFLAVGSGAFVAAIFHLMTHAFFKALLFLGSGSVIEACHHEQDMRKMGGLGKKMPITRTTFIAGSLALAGVPIFAGFFSKDEILYSAFTSGGLGWLGKALWVLGAAAALLTAFYITRAVALTFYGEPRDKHIHEHAKESPSVMTVPLMILAVLSTVGGFLGIPIFRGMNAMHNWLSPAVGGHGAEAAEGAPGPGRRGPRGRGRALPHPGAGADGGVGGHRRARGLVGLADLHRQAGPGQGLRGPLRGHVQGALAQVLRGRDLPRDGGPAADRVQPLPVEGVRRRDHRRHGERGGEDHAGLRRVPAADPERLHRELRRRHHGGGHSDHELRTLRRRPLMPILSIIVFLPLLGALLLWLAPMPAVSQRWTALLVALANFAISLGLWFGFDRSTHAFQFVEQARWIPQFGISYHVGVDGISLLLVLLTTLLSAVAILASFSAVTEKTRGYYAFLLVLETGMLGVFVALDLFFFYVFWEAMLIPMYFLIGVWGGQRRIYAAVKFFLYTMFGSLLMLVAIIFLAVAHKAQTGTLTFDLLALYSTTLTRTQELLLFSAYALAFAIKVPLFPFHTWLPDAHVEAPTAGSVILAGVLLKMGTYGFVRFCLPLFPHATHTAVPWIMVLAVIGIIYGALVAMVQPDLKKLVAYSSVSHLGFVMLGIFALNIQGMQGGLLQMINHGLSTGALFLIVGMIYERRHTRLIEQFGGITKVMPLFAACFMIVTLSSVGLPGTNGFVGEFLILLGAFGHSKLYGVLAATGVILAACYMLWMFQRVMFGKVVHAENEKLKDLNPREFLTLVPLIVLIFWIGIYPKPFLDTMNASSLHVLSQVGVAAEAPETSVLPDRPEGDGIRASVERAAFENQTITPEPGTPPAPDAADPEAVPAPAAGEGTE